MNLCPQREKSSVRYCTVLERCLFIDFFFFFWACRLSHSSCFIPEANTCGSYNKVHTRAHSHTPAQRSPIRLCSANCSHPNTRHRLPRQHHSLKEQLLSTEVFRSFSANIIFSQTICSMLWAAVFFSDGWGTRNTVTYFSLSQWKI